MRGDRWSFAHLWLVSFLFLFPACTEPDFHLAPPPPLISFEELKQRISRIRGLPLPHDLFLETKGVGTIQSLMENSLGEEKEREHLQQVARVYARLGLLPEGTDLPKALLDLRLFHHGLHYDSRRKTISLPQGLSKSGLNLLAPPWVSEDIAKQLLLVHTLSHILQEEHFHWGEKIKNRNTEDLRLALRAVAEGDSVLVWIAYLIGGAQGNREKIINGLKHLARLAEQIDKEMAHLPELLRQRIAFQYLQGSEFVSWAYSLKGWQGVNTLFLTPPLSTKQILHPEKYYRKRENPLRITPWGLIRRFSGQKFMEETLGEWLIQILLGRTLPREEARSAAAGWAGDSLLVFQQRDELVLGWVTAWDDREEAREFYGSFRRALEKRHGVSLEPAQTSANTLITPQQSRRALLLQTRDNFVFFLDGIPAPRSVEVAEGVWSELETGTEPEPLELAGRGRQSAALIR